MSRSCVAVVSSATVASSATSQRSASELLKNPTASSARRSSRPATGIPSRNSSRPLYRATITWTQVTSTANTVVCSARARSRTASMVDSATGTVTRPP